MSLRFLLLSVLVGAAIMVSGWIYAPIGTRWLTLGLGGLLVALALIDWRTYRLPDPLNLSVLLLGGLMVAMTRPENWLHHVIGALMGYAVLVAVELTYRRTRGRDGLGRGDAKLMGALGMWTGWIGLAPILLVASVSGLIAALVIGQKTEGGPMIAFGPWIALGGWLVWLFGAQFGFGPL